MSSELGWIGVDLDGTLAEYDGYQGDLIGKPIPAMLNRVMGWLVEGRDVRVFTARACRAGQPDWVGTKKAIDDWLYKHLGRTLPITNQKDFTMVQLWDDRAVRVEFNTGKVLGAEGL